MTFWSRFTMLATIPLAGSIALFSNLGCDHHVVTGASTATVAVAATNVFVHPGILHTQADLDRMKTMVSQGREPYKSGFQKLADDPQSQADWKIKGPFETVTRESGGIAGDQHNSALAMDGNAAYQNALLWRLTGDPAHAKKAREILNAWAGTLKTINGHDAILAAGLYGFKYVNAAELLRGSDPDWKPEDIDRFKRMLREVFYPVIKDFATFANGNWDAACIKTMLAIGVFLDDREIFNRAVDYYYHGPGDGSLDHYVINLAGECQESGRDQQHTQLGLADLAEACEVGWNQSQDMYGAEDNRLLKGFEYTAKYNLGNPVPFISYTDTTGRYHWSTISAQGRGELRPIWEMVWNHYQNRRGISAPYTKQAADHIRPEGAAFQADHPGFGTLLFTRPAETNGAQPNKSVANGR